METLIHIMVDDEGTPRTVNKQVKVKMIGERYVQAGASAEEIAGHYGITLADVHAALAHYFDHQAAFEQQSASNQALIREHGQAGKELLKKWQEKHDKRDGAS